MLCKKLASQNLIFQKKIKVALKFACTMYNEGITSKSRRVHA